MELTFIHSDQSAHHVASVPITGSSNSTYLQAAPFCYIIYCIYFIYVFVFMTDFGRLYVNIPIWLLFKINETSIFVMCVQIKQLCITIC